MSQRRNGGYSYAPSDQPRPKPAPAPAHPPDKVTTFEPCGFRAKTTGTLIANLDSAYEYGVRQPNGRKLAEEQWEDWVADHFEVVYRIIPVGTDSENCEACSKTGNHLACEDHFYA